MRLRAEGGTMISRGKSGSEQLSRDELQQLKWLLGGVLTLISVATVFYLDIAAWTLLVLTTVAMVAVLARPGLPGRIPRWAHRLAFPVIVAVFTSDLWLSGELLPSMVRLDILLLLYRGITYRRKRDDLQVIVLGLFLVVVAGVLTVSLTFAVHILAFTACALALLLVITLAEASAGGAVGPVAPGSTPEWARHVAWARLLRRVRQVTDWRVVVMGGALFAGLVALSALLFVAIPRFQLENGLFLERFISKKSKTGFSDTIRFGDVTDIQQDNSVALSVDVSDRNQIPDAPYWRMLVLDEYREGTFRLSNALRRLGYSAERNGAFVRGTADQKDGGDEVWTFYLESGVSRYLPLLGPFEGLRFRERQSYRLMRGLEVLELRNEPVTMVAYRVEGMQSRNLLPDAGFGARYAARDAGSPDLGLMLEIPLDDGDREVLVRIGKDITGGASWSAAEFGRGASAWLAQRHGYTLQPRIPAGPGDLLVRWLTSTESGHCELFAGSLVVLARAAGLPARVVTGFRGGSWNGYSNNFTLRNSDAHAWCELFDTTTQAWLRVDPTPGVAAAGTNETRGEAAIAQRNDRSWKARLESLRVFWYRQIVNFDQQTQLETLTAVKQATKESGRRLREWLDRTGADFREWLAAPWTGSRAGMMGAGAMAVIGLGWLIWVGRRARWRLPWGSRSSRGDAVRLEAGRWLARLRDRRPSLTGEAAGVWAELERLRFGARETWPEPARVFRRARKLRREKERRVESSPPSGPRLR